MHIIGLAGQAPRLHSQLSSNVKLHSQHPAASTGCPATYSVFSTASLRMQCTQLPPSAPGRPQTSRLSCSRLAWLFLRVAALWGALFASPSVLGQFLVGASRRFIGQSVGRGFAAGSRGLSSSVVGAPCARQLPQVHGTAGSSNSVQPNRSLELTRSGVALGPRYRPSYHRSRGPSATPALAPQLQR